MANRCRLVHLTLALKWLLHLTGSFLMQYMAVGYSLFYYLLLVSPVSLCAQIVKFTLKRLYFGREIYSDMDKIWRANVSILCMLLKYL